VASAQLAAVSAPYDAAQAGQERLQDLNRQILRTQKEAELFTYLRHPWPQTQLLAAVTEPITDSVVLTELRIGRQFDAPLRRRETRSGAERDGEPADSAATLAEQDLVQLRQACDERSVVIHLVGVTTDAADLHSYMGHLRAKDLFLKAELSSMESHASDEDQLKVSFRAKLLVRPGYGQPHGPLGPVQATAGQDGGPS
jgi:hypothetical protein